LNLFNRKSNSFKHFKYSPFHKNTIGSNEVLDINEDKKGNLWVATWGGGLSLYNRSNNTFTRFLNNPADKNSVSSNYIQKVFEDSKQKLWVATYFGGLNLLNAETKQFTRIVYGKIIARNYWEIILFLSTKTKKGISGLVLTTAV